jgi:hypothetical protein
MQAADERDRRAMLLAIANAQAQAVRVSEEHRASARAARDVQAYIYVC